MPISQARMAEWSCTVCGRVTPRLTWLAVHAVERPDLVAQLMDLLECECPGCSRPLRRSQPLLVLRMARTAPVIAACASDDELDPLESLGEVVATVRRELGDGLSEVPGPAVIVTFEELEAGARADIDTDIAASAADTGEAVDHGRVYRRLLEKIEMAQDQQRLEVGFEQLALVGSEAHLREVVERFPQVITDKAEQFAERRLAVAPTEENRQFASSMLRTVQLCRLGDFRRAWSVRASVIISFWEETVFPRVRAYEEATRNATGQPLAQAGRDLLAVLPSGTHPALEVDATASTMVGLLEDEGSDRDQSAENVIELGQLALSILDAHPDVDQPQLRLQIATNLAMAFEMRPRGDPVWNLTRGITYLKGALDRFPPAVDLDSWAMAQTNLAVLMINRREVGDHDRAREHLELSLTHRSFERDPHDWAYTQLNLALSYSRAESGDQRANVETAIGHAAKARDAARLTDDIPLLTYAEHNLAVEQYRLSQMATTTSARRAMLLDRAEASATEVARLSSAVESPLRYGRAWLILGKVRSAQGNERAAIEAFGTALTVLSAATWPIEAREASRLLMELAEKHGDVELAADAAEHLVEAAATAITARSRSEDRISEHSGKRSTDFRFAAHALVRARRVGEALVALERGRARELGMLTLPERVDLDTLSHLDPTLHAGVEEVGASFRADILGLEERSASDRAEQFALLLSTIEQTPALETSLDPPTLDGIGEVAQPRFPIVYLGSAPRGSLAIIVDRDRDGHVELDAIHAPGCESSAIAQLAMMGISPSTGEFEGTANAYLHAQMHAPQNLDTSLAALSLIIGEQLLRPLRDQLASRGAAGVTLVPAGLLGLMPLHAIDWNDAAGNRRCLLEDFDVTFAPSSRLHAACIQRAHQRAGDPVRFVGIANPLPHPSPLESSELEIELIQRLVPTGDCLTLKREEATKQRVVEALPSATHVHLACHAGARFLDPQFSAAVSLADEEELSALEVARLEIPARLVVASACETGVPQGYNEVDESLSLASAFIAAGAAGVVSALWQVEDFATALIISKFYEGLWGANKPPATALREAQLWIRGAAEEAIDAYLLDRPALRSLRAGRRASIAADGQTPFGAPSIWAAFAFSGA